MWIELFWDMHILVGVFLNNIPSVGILNNLVRVEPPINAAAHPVGADARPALFI